MCGQGSVKVAAAPPRMASSRPFPRPPGGRGAFYPKSPSPAPLPCWSLTENCAAGRESPHRRRHSAPGPLPRHSTSPALLKLPQHPARHVAADSGTGTLHIGQTKGPAERGDCGFDQGCLGSPGGFDLSNARFKLLVGSRTRRSGREPPPGERRAPGAPAAGRAAGRVAGLPWPRRYRSSARTVPSGRESWEKKSSRKECMADWGKSS